MNSDTRPLDISLKLLGDDNVILAKCDGFETEIFMPSIIDGRITIINVIPQRRCNCISTTYIVGKRKKPFKSFDSPSATITKWRMSTSSQSSLKRQPTDRGAPLANSTPTQQKSNVDATRRNSQTETQDSSIPSPQQVRRAILPLNECIELHVPRKQRTPKSQRHVLPVSQTTKTYLKGDRNVTKPSTSSAKENTDTLSQISNMEYPQTPTEKTAIDSDLPNLISPYPALWRSVLEPTKTYSKHHYTPSKISLNRKPSKVSNFFVTPSKAPKTGKCTVEKKIKVVIDKKISISPKSYKEQLKTSVLPSRQSLHDELHKRARKMKKKTAFALLTTPSNTNGCLSAKLEQQFKKRCVNKASSTYPRYKKLCVLPCEAQPKIPTPAMEHFSSENYTKESKKEGFFTPESISDASGPISPSLNSFQIN